MRKPTKFLNFDLVVNAVKDASQECIIEGYANTSTKDRVGDVVLPSAFSSSLKTYLDNPVLLENHNWDKIAGVTQHAEITDKGLFIRAKISETRPDLKQQIREGCLRTFSIGYNELDADYDEGTKTKIVKNIELLEISVVSVPANPEAKFVEISSNNPIPAPKEDGKAENSPVEVSAMAQEGQKAADGLQACLADKIPKLLDEGYDRDQAIAIAYNYYGEKKDCCKSSAKYVKELNKFISDVEEASGAELSVKSLIAVCDYFNTNEEKMTKKELIDLLKQKSAPEVKADAAPMAQPAEAKPTDAPKEDDIAKALQALMAKVDQLAQAMAQILEADRAEESAEAQPAAAPAKPAEAPKADDAAKELPAATEDSAAPATCPNPNCRGKMADTDGVMKCEKCGAPAAAPMDEEKSLEEIDKEIAELDEAIAQLS